MEQPGDHAPVISPRSSEILDHAILFRLGANRNVAGSIVGQYGGIENSLHWVMDVTFKEDASLVRKSHADDNLPTVRRWALNLCRLDQTPKLTVDLKRKSASFSDAFREQLLTDSLGASPLR